VRRPPFFPSDATEWRASVVGGALALVNLASAALLGQGLSDVTRDPRRALGLIVVVVGQRFLSGLVAAHFAERGRTTLKHYWRARIGPWLASPSPDGDTARSALTLAIDQAAEWPALTSTQAGAGVSLVGLVVIFLSGGWLSLAITLVLIGVSIPLYIRAGRASEAVAQRYHQVRGLLESRQLVLLAHGVELRGAGAVAYGAREIAGISDAEHDVALRAIRVTLSSSLITEFLSGLSIGLVAMVVGFGLLGGRLSLTAALIAVLVASEVFGAVRRLGLDFHRRDEAVHARELLTSQTPGTHPRAGHVLAATDLQTTATATPLTFSVGPGEQLWLRGDSGAGKTTVVRTLLGWHPAAAGTTTRPASPVGYVTPTSPLMGGSVAENLLVSAGATREAVTLLEALGLGERFGDLDRPISPDGLGVSSGERVRLAIARALLAGVSHLVLDDVAGVLDEHSRDLVRAVLRQHPDLAIIEASADLPLFPDASSITVTA
jgi:ABC-type transport system involved in cytochrome bd biosynthesis fused ATPase/permease subunit